MDNNFFYAAFPLLWPFCGQLVLFVNFVAQFFKDLAQFIQSNWLAKLRSDQRNLLIYHIDQNCLTYAPKKSKKEGPAWLQKKERKGREITRGLCLSKGKDRCRIDLVAPTATMTSQKWVRENSLSGPPCHQHIPLSHYFLSLSQTFCFFLIFSLSLKKSHM